MIDKALVRKILEDHLIGSDCFLVSVSITSGNDIVVNIDSEQPVDLEYCVDLTRKVEADLDEIGDNYSLELGTYSISDPFVDIRHYRKNIGRQIELTTEDNKKVVGTLRNVEENTFEVDVEEKVLLGGDKRKKTIVQTKSFAYSDIKQAKLKF